MHQGQLGFHHCPPTQLLGPTSQRADQRRRVPVVLVSSGWQTLLSGSFTLCSTSVHFVSSLEILGFLVAKAPSQHGRLHVWSNSRGARRGQRTAEKECVKRTYAHVWQHCV